MAEEIERIYVIPLKKKGFKSSSSAPCAVKRVKSFLTRHMKAEEENIWIDDSLNNAIWAQGKYRMPGKIRVKAVKFEDGVVEAYLPELEFKKSRRELLKEEREKKEPILKKEEVGVEEEAVEAPGAEEYDISPTADGEVKIKKKRGPKKKEEKKKEKEEKKPIKKPKKAKKLSKKEKKEMKKEEKTKKLRERKESRKTRFKTTKKSTSKSKIKKKTASKSAKKKSE